MLPHYRGMFETFKRMYHEEGVVSLYRGMWLNFVAGGIANLVFFYV